MPTVLAYPATPPQKPRTAGCWIGSILLLLAYGLGLPAQAQKESPEFHENLFPEGAMIKVPAHELSRMRAGPFKDGPLPANCNLNAFFAPNAQSRLSDIQILENRFAQHPGVPTLERLWTKVAVLEQAGCEVWMPMNENGDLYRSSRLGRWQALNKARAQQGSPQSQAQPSPGFRGPLSLPGVKPDMTGLQARAERVLPEPLRGIAQLGSRTANAPAGATQTPSGEAVAGKGFSAGQTLETKLAQFYEVAGDTQNRSREMVDRCVRQPRRDLQRWPRFEVLQTQSLNGQIWVQLRSLDTPNCQGWVADGDIMRAR